MQIFLNIKRRKKRKRNKVGKKKERKKLSFFKGYFYLGDLKNQA